jgi:sulfate/thiosulfate transport system ATP-binding protein
VDITPERYKSLALKPNETVYVTPKSAKIFESDYTI